MMGWTWLERFAMVQTPWVTLLGERWLDSEGQGLDYWRVERANSLIVLPQQGDLLWLPRPIFRPGVGQETWDLPGGRLTDLGLREETVGNILGRELGWAATVIREMRPINGEGWAVNSSFSNQRLYGYWVDIDPNADPPPEAIAVSFRIPEEVPQLLQRLTCLQCRALFLEWQQQRFGPF